MGFFGRERVAGEGEVEEGAVAGVPVEDFLADGAAELPGVVVVVGQGGAEVAEMGGAQEPTLMDFLDGVHEFERGVDGLGRRRWGRRGRRGQRVDAALEGRGAGMTAGSRGDADHREDADAGAADDFGGVGGVEEQFALGEGFFGELGGLELETGSGEVDEVLVVLALFFEREFGHDFSPFVEA